MLKGKIIDYTKNFKLYPKCCFCKTIKDSPSVSYAKEIWDRDVTYDGYIDYACYANANEDSLCSCFKTTKIRHLGKDIKNNSIYNNYCSNNYELCDNYNKAIEFSKKEYYKYLYYILFCQMDKSRKLYPLGYFDSDLNRTANIIIGARVKKTIKFDNFNYKEISIDENKEIIKNLTDINNEDIKKLYKYEYGWNSHFHYNQPRQEYYSYKNCQQVKKDLDAKYEFIDNEIHVSNYESVNRNRFITKLVELSFLNENGNPKISKDYSSWRQMTDSKKDKIKEQVILEKENYFEQCFK